jgi:hypothetical protein
LQTFDFVFRFVSSPMARTECSSTHRINYVPWVVIPDYTKKSMLTGTQMRSGRRFSRARPKTLKQDDPASSNIGLKPFLWCPAFSIAASDRLMLAWR